MQTEKKQGKAHELSKEALVYFIGVAGLVFLFATYIPYVLDYYIVRPDMPLLTFMYDRGDIANPNYGFEEMFIGLGLLFLYCLTAHAGSSTLVASLLLFALTHASYIKYVNRKELLHLDDLRLTEAAGMALNYLKFSYSSYLLVLLGWLVGLTAAGFGLEYLKKRFCKDTVRHSKQIKYILLRLVCAAGLVVAMVCYSNFYFTGRLSWEVIDRMSLEEPDDNRYVLFRFLQNDRLAAIGLEDVETCREDLLQKSPARSMDAYAERPDIIVVMNESWWNTDQVDPERVTFSTDPMQAFKELSATCVTGHLTSNVYGGGTVSSETEFLTGVDTKYFVHDSTVYDQTEGRKLPSVVDYLRAQGYFTTAIHPYYPGFYKRVSVYNAMGFDKKIFADEMKYKETYSKYISDESVVKQIIYEYEEGRKRTDSPENQFIWAITMANHIRLLDYESDYPEGYDYPIQVTLQEPLDDPAAEDNLVNYINGIYLAGNAFEQLVSYFAKQDRPVIVVMYGDHCPSFTEEMLQAMGLSMFDDSEEMREKLYSVPIVFWSNFGNMEELRFTGEGIYYLSDIVFEYAGLPDSDMMRIRRLEREHFKANCRKVVLDASGEAMGQCTEEQMHILNEIKTIEYDILFGELQCADIWAPME